MSESAAIFASFFWDGTDQAPLHDVTLIGENGIIREIVPGKLPQAHAPGNLAIIPPLVNAHVHLEFSTLQKRVPFTDSFAGWIGETIATRMANDNLVAAIEQGLKESSEAGVGIEADVLTTDDYPQLAEDVPWHLMFRELIGLTDESVGRQKQIATDFLDVIHKQDRQPRPLALRRKRKPYGKLDGLSPHAPYTVRPALLQFCVEQSAALQVPLMMHLAETQAELELMDSGTGELVDFLAARNLWSGNLYPAGTTPLDLLKTLSPAHRVLLAHGNYFTDQEIAYLAERSQFHVIYCPRTHAYFGHPEHPWLKLLDQGVNVAVGTDGKGSNPDLSLWNELCFLAEAYPEIDRETLISLGTMNGSRALGIETTIETGRPAAFTVLSNPADSDCKFQDWDDLFQPGIQPKSACLL